MGRPLQSLKQSLIAPVYLNYGMQKGNSIESRFPLWHVSNVQLILGDTSVGSFQSWLHALWRLIGELDGRLVNTMYK